MDYIKVNGLPKDEVIGLVKAWIKLYPHSFNPEVNFWFYQLAENKVIIGLHDDLSTLAVSLLVIYLTSAVQKVPAVEPVVAYFTVDDNEILLKQNYGRRAKIIAKCTDDDNTGVIILLENNYCVDYYFRGKAHKIKDSELVFLEPALPESIANADKDEIFVGDIIPYNKTELSPEEDVSPWKKLMWYSICTVIGLGIGFLLVHYYF